MIKCQQQYLFDKVQEATTVPTCNDIMNYGILSYAHCFVQPIPDQPEVTFANLSNSDIMKIYEIAGASLWDILVSVIPQLESKLLEAQ